MTGAKIMVHELAYAVRPVLKHTCHRAWLFCYRCALSGVCRPAEGGRGGTSIAQP